MGDRAHSWTDWKIGEIEKELARIYSRAEKELEEKAAKYFKRFEELDAKKRALVDAGKMTEKDYQKWRTGKIMTGKHWTEMKQQTARELLKVNETATAYVNDQLPTVYVRNYNQVANGINGQVKGYSFELVDSSTVRRLATDDKTLLPYKYIDGVKDVRWNTQKVNSEVLQGILQGDSIPNLAKRLRNVTEMNKASSIRNARTSCTSAENKGRMDMIEEAEDKGVHVQKGWMATKDDRTRETHADLDGVFVDPDEEFDNGLQYPGDPDGEPEEVYNCRCTLVYKVVSINEKELKTEVANTEQKEADPVHLPDTIFKEKQSNALEDYLNGIEGRDSNVAELYNKIGELADEKNYGIKVSYTQGDHSVGSYADYKGDVKKVDVKIPKMEGDLNEKAETTLHELGHLADQLYGGNEYETARSMELIDAIGNGNPISESTMSLFEQLKEDGKNAFDRAMISVKETNEEYNNKISAAFHDGNYSQAKQLMKERDKSWRDGVREAAAAQSTAHKGYGPLEDIYDAITGGDLYSHGYYGHGSKYYSSEANKAAEVFANYCSLSQVNPGVFDLLKKEQPEICEACNKIIEEMIGR